ncbi:flagellar assembly protein FliW [Candidatus Hydrogenedentota bacterium]
MKTKTTRFGEIEVEESTIIEFVQPIIGFPEHKSFVLLPTSEDSPFVWLQSTEDPELAFIVVDTLRIMPDYNIELPASEVEDVQIEKEEDALLMTLVVIAGGGEVRTNLKAPIVLNKIKNLAKQVILPQDDYPVRYVLKKGATEEREETSDARSDA